ncbi:hypothetical protein F1880_000091 [Penicillium rolfsii]|nr:hypothetical protein F1880_000091 [Penicillium rolfsii]
MTIICGDRIFKAHRLVVCSQSEYFQKACCGNFKEAHEPIRFPGKHPAVMEKVLEFLYTGDYTLNLETGLSSEASSSLNSKDQQSSSSATGSFVVVDSFSNPARRRLSQSISSIDAPVGNNNGDIEALPTKNRAIFHARMYEEGDYLLIEGLKTKAQANFTTDLTKSLRKESPKIAALDETLEVLYSSRANYYSLRSIAIRQIVENIKVVSVKHGVPLQNSIKSIPDFAFDLCMALIRERRSPKSDPEPPSRVGKLKTPPKTPNGILNRRDGVRNDLKIICGSEILHANKVIVCSHSEYFKKTCSASFKETTEALRLTDQEEILMRKVLKHLYTSAYSLDFAQFGKHREGVQPVRPR